MEDDEAPSTRLVAAALAWRTAPPDRTSASELLREQILPLYLYYIDDHIGRRGSLGKADLVEAFQDWRDRLVR